MTTSEATIQNELAWLANRYVAGELSVDETAAFEARLETDVAACSAVADAMELNLAIAAAFDQEALQPVARPTHETVTPTRWSVASLAALASLAAVAASIALMVGHLGSTTNGVARKDGADRIVAAWVSGEAARNDADDDDLLDTAHDDDLDPPDWMLAALTAEDVKEKLSGDDNVREN